MNTGETIFEEIKKEALDKNQEQEAFRAISLDELFSMKFPENKWVIEKLIPLEGITIISGAPASYKTWVLLQMAIHISKGESLLSKFQCEKHNVLIIDEENHMQLVLDRLKLLGADKDLPIHFLSQKGLLITKTGMVERILKICEENEIDVIFIDSLVRINNAEENDATQMSEVFRCIRRLCQNGKTVILTHHERKEGLNKSSASNRLRGSSDILAAVDAHISMKRNNSKIVIEQAKLRSAKEMESFEISVVESEGKVSFDFLGLHSEEASKKGSAKDIILAILEEEIEGLPRGEICQRVNEVKSIGDKSIKAAIDELLSENLLSEKGGIKNTKLCCLPKYIEDIANPEALI